ncbi:39S ribosomal protein L51, mitochondrial [Xylographa trunciseda]|nr:39S ribosomal protein L51, mitochondrial [Xylographa trunciseda]
MPVKALTKTSVARNGVGAFILQCKRLDFHYCDWAGSSKGMNQFLTHTLPAFSASAPGTEIHISPRPRAHPVIRAHYIAPSPSSPSTFAPPVRASAANTVTKAICVRNLSKEQILRKAELLRDGNGAKNRRVTGGRVVRSENEGVRGVWSPMHGVGSPLEGLGPKG